ncbi:MAG: CpaF family protein [Lachnospiraceae bacterium]|nr:CpaF family protein [Lachnospiraceae bacterium]
MDPKRSALYEALRAGLSGEEQLTDEMIYERIDRVLYAEGKRQRLTNEEKLKYRTILFSAVRELDILSYIMRDEDVTEIMVNGPDSIYVEKNGVIEAYPEGFTTEAMLPDVIQKIASSVNRRVNEATPMVDARLPDGSRVNVALPPVSLNGPVVTIRRFPKEPMSMEALVRIGSISREAAEYLRTLVECGYNIFISGGTGAGKTTFLGALAEYIPVNERVVTIEDSAELRLRKVRNLIRLESRPATLEGEYEVTIRDLIRNALRMRPDRVIVGEIRSGEALDMLSAMNTGHDGSLSTGHANSAADMLSRIETMVLMGMDLPLSAVRAQIASGIDILVHLGRLRDRSRRVLGIYEVLGVSEGEVKIEALFEFREEGTYAGRIEGRLIRTAHTLRRTEKLKQRAGRL